MRLSDAWFYLGHPVLWYREVYRERVARRVGQTVFEI